MNAPRSGYSTSPLPRKLGITADSRVAVLGGEIPRIDARSRLAPGLDVIVCFLRSRAALERRLPRLRDSLAPAGGLWIAWPKRSSGVATDLTEDVLREVVLPSGLVDNKVCAIDETWSGLRFVWRRELRP